MAVMFSFITIKFWSKIPEKSLNLARVSSLPPNSKNTIFGSLILAWGITLPQKRFSEVGKVFGGWQRVHGAPRAPAAEGPGGALASIISRQCGPAHAPSPERVALTESTTGAAPRVRRC